MLIGQAIAEVAAEVLKPGGAVSAAERQFFGDTLRDFPDLSADAVRVLEAYFEQCLNGKSTDALAGCLTHCKRHFRKVVLQIGVAIAEADGPLIAPRWQALQRLAARVGLDPDVELRGRRPLEDLPPVIGAKTCWAILQLSPRASLGDIKTAYRRQARKHHPDRLYNASPQARDAAEERMKGINAAFADALAAASKTATSADKGLYPDGNKSRPAKKHVAAKWVAVAGRPPYAVSSVTLLARSKRFARRDVLRIAALVSLAVIARLGFGLVTSGSRAWWNDAYLCAILVVVAACLAGLGGALFGRGIRVAAWTFALLGFAVIAEFWYQGLGKAIEYERRHARENQFESNPR